MERTVNDRIAEVLAAADRLIAAYGNWDIEAYLAFFAPDVRLIFYHDARIFDSRAAWATELAKLDSEGYKILSCTSTNQHVDVYGEVAIFTHDVTTVELSVSGSKGMLKERETIIFKLQEDGRWLAVHEHLSGKPSPMA